MTGDELEQNAIKNKEEKPKRQNQQNEHVKKEGVEGRDSEYGSKNRWKKEKSRFNTFMIRFVVSNFGYSP